MIITIALIQGIISLDLVNRVDIGSQESVLVDDIVLTKELLISSITIEILSSFNSNYFSHHNNSKTKGRI